MIRQIVYVPLLILAIVLFSSSCEGEASTKPIDTETKNQLFSMRLERDTVLLYSFSEKEFEVSVRVPNSEFKGVLLLLQGWDFSNTSWCDSTDLCTKALDLGYALVMPDMGKSIYSKHIYSHTRADWQRYPTRSYLIDSVISDLHNQFNLFDPKHFNSVLGLSTGGRGALLLALDAPEIFDAGASLSGDFDMNDFPKDNLYRGYFGEKIVHPEIWDGEENPTSRIDRLIVPFYFGHGEKDEVVSFAHYKGIQSSINEASNSISHVFHSDSSAQHSYVYWKSEVDQILNFYEEVRSSNKKE